jgi:tetratricopeptide (TPR) repeat protein
MPMPVAAHSPATVRGRAVTMGKIADILRGRGDLDEALRIRREEELPVYEQLDDMRERAVALSKIAQIMAIRGDVPAARALQEECLDVSRRLGDAEGIGAALWDLAQLDLADEKLKAAIPRITEAYDIVLRVGRATGIAIVGLTYARVLDAEGRRAEALTVLRRSAEMFRKLGQVDEAQRVEQLVRELDPGL